MADTITYDDSKLQRFFEQMTPAQRRKALRGGLLRTANSVRKVARQNLMATNVHNADRLARLVRSRVEKKVIGFAVTIKAKAGKRGSGAGEKGMHVNRFGVKKPVLGWIELGTGIRTVRGKKRVVHTPSGKYITTGTKRGRVKPLNFMKKTEAQTQSLVTHQMQNLMRDSTRKTAKQCGFL